MGFILLPLYYNPSMKIIFLNTWDGTVKKEIERFITNHSKDTEIFCLQEIYEKMKVLCKDLFQEYMVASDYKHINDNESYFQNTYVRVSYSLGGENTVGRSHIQK